MPNNPTIFEAAHKGDFDYVKSKLNENPLLLTSKDSNQRMILHWASVGGNFKLATYLLDLGTPVDPLDDTETTPLVLASSAGHPETVELLIKKGADVNHKTDSGHSALQYAASKGWGEICIKLIESNADINIADNRNATPLHRAASKGNLEIVKYLLHHKNRLKINVMDVYGNTPLHLACEEDRQEEAKLLVQNGANLEARNAEHKTPLDLCSLKLYKVLVQLAGHNCKEV